MWRVKARDGDGMSAVVQLLYRLPGVGEKMAERIAAGIAVQPEDYKVALARAIEGHGAPVPCIVCGDDGGPEPCERCTTAAVDRSAIMVVKGPKDRERVEAARCWSGAFHVLRGLLHHGHGVGPEQLKVRSLFERLRGDTVREVVFALGGTDRARDTAAYLAGLMPPGVDVWALGVGVAFGQALEDADPEAIAEAIRQRKAVRV